MKYLMFIALAFTILLTGCKKETTQDEDIRILDAQFSSILATANSVECTNPEEWTFTPIGAKPCGGPANFLAYSTTIDTAAFLQSVAAYTAAQEDYNEKWGLTSDCTVLTPPSGVDCYEGIPSLIY